MNLLVCSTHPSIHPVEIAITRSQNAGGVEGRGCRSRLVTGSERPSPSWNREASSRKGTRARAPPPPPRGRGAADVDGSKRVHTLWRYTVSCRADAGGGRCRRRSERCKAQCPPRCSRTVHSPGMAWRPGSRSLVKRLLNH